MDPIPIAKEMFQLYYFQISPGKLDDAVTTLREVKLGLEYEAEKIGAPEIFSWLGRHGVLSMRWVRIMSGLDTFLLEHAGMLAIEDVAEMLCFQIEADKDQSTDPSCNSDFLSVTANRKSLVFQVFTRLHLTLLNSASVWKEITGHPTAPRSSQVLQGFSRALSEAAKAAYNASKLSIETIFHCVFGLGDADVVIIGSCKDTTSLEELLRIISNLGTDNLANAIYGESDRHFIHPHPLVSETTTEFFVPYSTYSDFLSEAAKTDKLSPELKSDGDRLLSGQLLATIGLKHGSVTEEVATHAIREVVGKAWDIRTVFGNIDFLISPKGTQSFGELLWLLARLDDAISRDPGFLRKASFRLAFGRDHGPFPVLVDRSEIFNSPKSRSLERWGDFDQVVPDAEDVNTMLMYVKELRNKRYREDLRIIERMAERALMIQKSPTLGLNTRMMARTALSRMAHTVRRIDFLRDEAVLLGSLADKEKNLSEKEKLKERRDKSEDAATFLRADLIFAGMEFDRALAHHTRGTLPLLFLSGIQGRGQDHIGSEILLSACMACYPKSIIGRLRKIIALNFEDAHSEYEWFINLLQHLDSLSDSIMYASHDEDFQVDRALGIIRIPRWVLWYPTSSSFIIHELGHRLELFANFETINEYLLLYFSFEAIVPQTTDVRRFFSALKSVDNWEQHCHEILADVIWRLFAFSEGQDDDAVFEMLNHCVHVAPRWNRKSRQQLISRILSVEVAVRFIRLGWKVNSERVFGMSRAQQEQEVETIKKTFFSKTLVRWIEAQYRETPGGHLLISDVEHFIETSFPKSGEAIVKSAVGFGLFAGFYVVSLGNKDLTKVGNNTIQHAGMLWQGILRCTLESSEADEEQLVRIARSIIAGEIPEERTKFPERVPCRVRTEMRKAGRVHTSAPLRLALSLFLKDATMDLQNR